MKPSPTNKIKPSPLTTTVRDLTVNKLKKCIITKVCRKDYYKISKYLDDKNAQG